MKKAPGIRGLFHIRVRESNYKPGSVACRHSSRCVVTHALKQPTRKVWPGRPLSYLVLLTTGYAKQDMSPHPLVSSYLTVSPLPLPAVCFLLRCPKVTLSGRYPASCPIEPGLSSPAFAAATTYPTPAMLEYGLFFSQVLSMDTGGELRTLLRLPVFSSLFRWLFFLGGLIRILCTPVVVLS